VRPVDEHPDHAGVLDREPGELEVADADRRDADRKAGRVDDGIDPLDADTGDERDRLPVNARRDEHDIAGLCDRERAADRRVLSGHVELGRGRRHRPRARDQRRAKN
jgi:hypothetical protein